MDMFQTLFCVSVAALIGLMAGIEIGHRITVKCVTADLTRAHEAEKARMPRAFADYRSKVRAKVRELKGRG